MDTRIEEEAMNFLIQRNWKGNVRELENAIARACILSDYKVIKLSHFQDPAERENRSAPFRGFGGFREGDGNEIDPRRVENNERQPDTRSHRDWE